jgi:hypothetical protein
MLALGRKRAGRSNIGGANTKEQNIADSTAIHRSERPVVESNRALKVNSDLGVEYIYADRKTEDGLKGRLNRLQASAKYAF